MIMLLSKRSLTTGQWNFWSRNTLRRHSELRLLRTTLMYRTIAVSTRQLSCSEPAASNKPTPVTNMPILLNSIGCQGD
ncbi:unnamed protein product [Chondrus crispus]|uniref:Uncharacterized protein n=1 Tax=Chondrus crispus TaxID=2769 RepID=R7QBX5_CHOCR|nr:unnamed protein product [Chondrus crispus]CDF34931.1 unnamed protein product [Chondrus crispus]|eukprot:XP_005714750.1 unnamed protein product [Chondrus crispus]